MSSLVEMIFFWRLVVLRIEMPLTCLLKCSFLADRSFCMTLFSFHTFSFSSIDFEKLFNIGSMLLFFKQRHCLVGNFFNFVDSFDDIEHSLDSMFTGN